MCPSRQVTFNDTLGYGGLAAVEVDKLSSYKAEDTSFSGDYGKVRIYRKRCTLKDTTVGVGSLFHPW